MYNKNAHFRSFDIPLHPDRSVLPPAEQESAIVIALVVQKAAYVEKIHPYSDEQV